MPSGVIGDQPSAANRANRSRRIDCSVLCGGLRSAADGAGTLAEAESAGAADALDEGAPGTALRARSPSQTSARNPRARMDVTRGEGPGFHAIAGDVMSTSPRGTRKVALSADTARARSASAILKPEISSDEPGPSIPVQDTLTPETLTWRRSAGLVEGGEPDRTRCRHDLVEDDGPMGGQRNGPARDDSRTIGADHDFIQMDGYVGRIRDGYVDVDEANAEDHGAYRGD